MKKDVENEIEELLAQIENKYQDQNEISFINSIGQIFKKLNMLRFLSVILIITLFVLMITNGVIILEFFIISVIFLAVVIIGYLVYSHYQHPVKRWRGEIIDDYYDKKTITQIIKSFFIKK